MFVVISRKCFAEGIEKAVTRFGDAISYSVTDNNIDISSEVIKILRLPFSHLILDISSVSVPDCIPNAVRKLRIFNDSARIIIIAPNAVPGDAAISHLVTMGVYDILNPSVGDEPFYDISDQLFDMLNRRPSYSYAVRWDRSAVNIAVSDDYTDSGSSQKNDADKKEIVTVIKEKIVGTVIIGVAGISPGIGCTHMSVAIAYYLAKYTDSNVAVMELNSSKDIYSLNAFNVPALLSDSFEYNGIHFYSYSHNTDLSDVISLNNYKYIVLDVGPLVLMSPGKTSLCAFYMEFLRSSLQLLVCGSKPWHEKYLRACLNKFMSDGRILPWKLIYNFTDVHEFKHISKLSDFSCFNAPYFTDIFTDDAAVKNFFGDVLRDVVPASHATKKRRGLFG